ncbi:hypothetical protein ACEQPO_07680 [Bacillus sp. SL00103]
MKRQQWGTQGRFIAVIILVLQLAASAGTFPLELAPKFFQVIHSLLPMTYTINGFRTIIASGDDSWLMAPSKADSWYSCNHHDGGNNCILCLERKKMKQDFSLIKESFLLIEEGFLI